MNKNSWQLQDAKSKFSNLVERAQKQGPQIVTKHGKKAVVIIDFNEYTKITKPKTDLISFLRNSPLFGLDLDIARDKNLPRDVIL